MTPSSADIELLSYVETFINQMNSKKVVLLLLLLPLEGCRTPITVSNVAENIEERIAFAQSWVDFMRQVAQQGNWIKANFPTVN